MFSEQLLRLFSNLLEFGIAIFLLIMFIFGISLLFLGFPIIDLLISGAVIWFGVSAMRIGR